MNSVTSSSLIFFCPYTGQKSHYPPANQMLSTSKNVLLPGHNHLLTTSDQHQWLAGGYDREIGHY